jgi:hypothetical protein
MCRGADELSQYLSKEWLELGRKAINAHEDFRRIARGMTLIISHRIRGVPGRGEVYFWSRFQDGECSEVQIGEHPDPQFLLSGGFAVWEQVHRGKLEILQAILEKKIQVEGKPVKGIRILRLAPLMNEIISQIETDFDLQQ